MSHLTATAGMPRAAASAMRALGAAVAALWLVTGAGAASAQTVIVTGAPTGTPVDVVLGTTAAGSGVVDAQGMATVVARPAEAVEKREMDALVYVDTCGERHRIVIVENGRDPVAPEAGCSRQQIPGIFWVQPISTLVVELGGAGPMLLLRQGRFTPPPPSADSPEQGRRGRPSRTWVLPTGLVLAAGGGFAWPTNLDVLTCGSVADCAVEDGWFSYGAGVSFWMSRYLAAEATWFHPTDTTTQGSGAGYRFDTVFDADVLSFGGKAGAPLGPVRLYGRGGANRQWSGFETTQIVDDRTVTIDGVDTVIKGGTQTLGFRTSGWGWYAGGGAEVWLNRWIGAYGEFERAVLKGEDGDGGEGALDDSLVSVTFGVRIHVGR